MTVMVPLAFALLLILLATLGAHDEQRVLERWDMRLNPEGLRVYSNVADEILWNRRMVESSVESAAKAKGEGSLSETIRFLDAAGWILGHCSDSLLALVRNVGQLARFAEAIAPMPPMDPAQFRMRRMLLLAGFHNLAHHSVVTTRERMWLRLAVLRGGIKACVPVLARAIARTRARAGDPSRWGRLEDAKADLGTLTDESLATLRSVLGSLAAVRRPVEAAERKTA
jgi:hypothetical protein